MVKNLLLQRSSTVDFACSMDDVHMTPQSRNNLASTLSDQGNNWESLCRRNDVVHKMAHIHTRTHTRREEISLLIFTLVDDLLLLVCYV